MRWRLIEHDCVDSTSERAFAALARGEARHADAHVARQQTAGRGRRGASWTSPRDEGLYLSVVLTPREPAPPAPLTMAGGLAVHDAATALGLTRGRLKWPNDLVVDAADDVAGDGPGAKLAGVLVETRGLDPAKPHYVLGIGMNVRQREFPAELVAQRPVTSLLACGIDVPLAHVRDEVLARLAERLAQAFAGAPRLCDDFAAAARLAGRELEVEFGEARVRGSFAGLTPRGLLVRTDTGDVTCALEHVRALRRE